MPLCRGALSEGAGVARDGENDGDYCGDTERQMASLGHSLPSRLGWRTGGDSMPAAAAMEG